MTMKRRENVTSPPSQTSAPISQFSSSPRYPMNRPKQVLTTNHHSLFRSRDWLSTNQGSVFPDSVGSCSPSDPDLVASLGKIILSVNRGATKSGATKLGSDCIQRAASLLPDSRCRHQNINLIGKYQGLGTPYLNRPNQEILADNQSPDLNNEF
eukprot:sb/3473265/